MVVVKAPTRRWPNLQLVSHDLIPQYGNVVPLTPLASQTLEVFLPGAFADKLTPAGSSTARSSEEGLQVSHSPLLYLLPTSPLLPAALPSLIR